MHSTINHHFSTQLPRNLAGNISFFLVNLIIGLFLVPYFISTLGVAAYGIIPLASSLNGYVGLLTQSLNTSVSRFLTVDLQRQDYSGANRTFNTALFGITGIIILMIPIVILISLYSPVIFNVPSVQEAGAVYLFLGVTSAFLIRSWSGNFSVSLFAYNRLDLQNFVGIVNIIIQVICIVAFFSLFGPSLAYVGLAYLIGGITASILDVFLARKINPHLVISIRDFDPSRFSDIAGMGWWVIVNQVGSLLFLNIDIILVNLLFGATPAGEYAVALQWVVLLRAIAGTVSGVLSPIVLIYYAKEQTGTLIRVSRSAVKLMGLFMALPIGLVCGFAPVLLTVWVGNEFSFLSLLLIILTGHLCINLAVLPLFSINVAYNRVKIPGILTLLMGMGNAVLAIVLSRDAGLGYYGVALAGAIVLTLKNAFFTPWYATRVLGVSPHTFSGAMIPGVIAALVLAACAAVFSSIFVITNLVWLAVAAGIFSILYLVIIWTVGLDNFEQGIFISYLPKCRREGGK